MRLNENGMIVQNEWIRTSQLRRNVIIDEFIVMPNHIHGIIIINDVGAHCNVPLRQIESFGKSTKNSIPTIVKLFKSATTKQINERQNAYEQRVWQRNYYEHIIRNDKELNSIREYIMQNPLQWQFDRNNPDCVDR
jgi:REP element-mobilizing transposase RayT